MVSSEKKVDHARAQNASKLILGMRNVHVDKQQKFYSLPKRYNKI
jgi:hypothetical protein